MRKYIYLILAVIGFIVPFYFFFQFITANGLNVALLFKELFANNISTFFAADLIISIIVFWVWVLAEADRLQMKNSWAYILASMFVGLSFAFPLFLYFREQKLEFK